MNVPIPVSGLEAAIIGLLVAVQVPQPNIPDNSATCLALNMYHEARGQGIAGELAVSAVVLNRVNDKRFPNTICEVVKQGPSPAWAKTKTKTVEIQDHIFYRWEK